MQSPRKLNKSRKRLKSSTIKRALNPNPKILSLYNTVIHQGRYKLKFKDENILSIGMISLAIGVLVGSFTHFEYSGFSVSYFVEGAMTGVSLVMNLFYLAKNQRNRRIKH